MIKSKKILLFILVLVIGLSTLASVIFTVSAAKSTAISISFSGQFSDKVYVSSSDDAKIRWTNSDSKQATGSFLFILTANEPLNIQDVTFTFKEQIVIPEKSDASLLFYLPQQTFPARQSGTTTVSVIYNQPNEYNWQAQIVNMK